MCMGLSNFSEEVFFNVMGWFYNKIVSFFVVMCYFVYIVFVVIIFVIFFLIILFIGNIFIEFEGQNLFWFFIWFEIVWLSIWVVKLVVYVILVVFMFFCGVISLGIRKYVIVLCVFEILFLFFLWGLVLWFIFKFMFLDRNNGVKWIDIVQRILLLLFFVLVVFFVEKVIVQFISIFYYQRLFVNCIKDFKCEIYIFGFMYEVLCMFFFMYCQEFVDEDYIINDSIDVIFIGGRLNGKGVVVVFMKFVGEVG